MLSFFPEFLRNINNFVEKEATSVMLLKDIILHVYVHHIIPYTAVINFITLIYVFLNNLNCLGCRMHHPPRRQCYVACLHTLKVTAPVT